MLARKISLFYFLVMCLFVTRVLRAQNWSAPTKRANQWYELSELAPSMSPVYKDIENGSVRTFTYRIPNDFDGVGTGLYQYTNYVDKKYKIRWALGRPLKTGGFKEVYVRVRYDASKEYKYIAQDDFYINGQKICSKGQAYGEVQTPMVCYADAPDYSEKPFTSHVFKSGDVNYAFFLAADATKNNPVFVLWSVFSSTDYGTQAQRQSSSGEVNGAAITKNLNKFEFQYNYEPTPGKRIWTKIDSGTWMEECPDGARDFFIIIGDYTLDGVEGVLVRKASIKYDADIFIPYKNNSNVWFRMKFKSENEWRNIAPITYIK